MLCIYAFEIGEFINHFYSFRSRNQSLLSAPEEGKGGKSLKSVSLLSWSTDMCLRGDEGVRWRGENPSSTIMTGPWIRRLSTFASCSCSFLAGVPMNDNSSGYDWKYTHTHTKKQPPPLKKKGKKWLLPLGFTCIQTASVIKNARWVTPSSIMDVPFQRKTIHSIHV